jgi:hypothetical protein
MPKNKLMFVQCVPEKNAIWMFQIFTQLIVVHGRNLRDEFWLIKFSKPKFSKVK